MSDETFVVKDMRFHQFVIVDDFLTEAEDLDNLDKLVYVYLLYAKNRNLDEVQTVNCISHFLQMYVDEVEQRLSKLRELDYID
ncbi:hypothetical protein D3C81_1747590 [compost metagenome]